MAKLIYLDPGHGGGDSGAVGLGYLEKYITLDYAKKVKESLIRNGFRVAMSRESDIAVSLTDRYQDANTKNADLFVSFHANSHHTEKANGVESFRHPKSSQESVKFVNIVQKKLAPLYKSDRGVKTANFAVLKGTRMAAVLLELGFIKNRGDMNVTVGKMNTVVEEIVKAICEHYGQEYIPKGSTGNVQPPAPIANLYRVRTEWNKPQTQKGAYSSLKNAIALADKLGGGYKVYNDKGEQVHPRKKHWADKHYISLNQKGIEIHEARFDDPITRGEAMALLDRATEKRSL